jgi:hypothetical protein
MSSSGRNICDSQTIQSLKDKVDERHASYPPASDGSQSPHTVQGIRCALKEGVATRF